MISPRALPAFWRRQPRRTLAVLLAGWAALVVFNYVVGVRWLALGTPLLFPVSLFETPRLHAEGLPALAAFAIVLAFALARAQRLRPAELMAAAVALIVLGNLCQGSFDAAFRRPFYASGIQYYHDAVKIPDAAAWLRGFNDQQASLLPHSRTHPPFAVLGLYGLLRLFRGSLTGLALAMVAVSCLSVDLVRRMLDALARDLEGSSATSARERRNVATLLFAVFPAVNIYTIASLDAVVLTAATLVPLGLLGLAGQEGIERPRRTDGATTRHVVLIATGVVATNLLTFGGVFLFGLLGLLALRAVVLRRRPVPHLAALVVAAAALAVVVVALRVGFGYDHLRAFRTASAIENPGGFALFVAPARNLMTRVEDVTEIAFFLSFGALAFAVRAGLRRRILPAWRENDDVGAMVVAAVALLLTMFILGAYKTGETARACLFIYPYLLLPLARLPLENVRDVTVLAAVQTGVMQVLGGYFW